MLVLVTFMAMPAAAAPLDEARAEVQGLRYPQAARTLAQVAQARSLTRAEVLEYYELTGRVSATLDDAPTAREAFSRLLALAPEHTLKGRPAPRVATPYLEARSLARVLGAPTAAFRAPTVVGEEVRLPLDCANLTPWAVTEVLVRLEDGQGRRELRLPAAPELALTVKGDTARVAVSLLDGRGWVLVEQPERAFDLPLLVSVAAPALSPLSTAATPVVHAPVPVDAAPRWRALTVGLAVGSALTLAGAGGAGLVVADVRRRFGQVTLDDTGVVQSLTRAQALQLEAQERQAVGATNLLLGAGGLLAASALILYLVDRPTASPVVLSVGVDGSWTAGVRF